MEYPSLSLNQGLIDRFFGGAKYGVKDKSGENLSPTSTMTNNHQRSRVKKYERDKVKDRERGRIQKENRLKKLILNPVNRWQLPTLHFTT